MNIFSVLLKPLCYSFVQKVNDYWECRDFKDKQSSNPEFLSFFWFNTGKIFTWSRDNMLTIITRSLFQGFLSNGNGSYHSQKLFCQIPTSEFTRYIP
jgi:hypothetical protein